DLLRSVLPARDIAVHADFGFPPHIGNDTLFVISSYSGNTEEALDAFRAVREKQRHVAIITSGGILLEEARREEIPTIEIPEHNLPPRLAIGYSVKALLALMGDAGASAKVAAISIPESIKTEGKALAERLNGMTPLIYASRRIGGLAYYWKVVMNETAKVQAFANCFPEAGHNEIEGFENAPTAHIACITLSDSEDDPRVQQRLALFSRTCREKEIIISPLTLVGANIWERVFRSITLANWTAYYIARARGIDPSTTPFIEKWKRELRRT
ncbi:MAG: SIS domain-containing protein, partial [Candidatus Brennerbacteria bacterium]